MALSLTGQFPAYRPRRLRQSPALRRLVAETRLSAEQLVLPLFVRPGRKLRRGIAAMPGVFQLSPDQLLREASLIDGYKDVLWQYRKFSNDFSAVDLRNETSKLTSP